MWISWPKNEIQISEAAKKNNVFCSERFFICVCEWKEKKRIRKVKHFEGKKKTFLCHPSYIHLSYLFVDTGSLEKLEKQSFKLFLS